MHLDVEGREVRLPPRLARVLGGVLTHLVRNAVAHGIEPPPARVESGKPPGGTIRIAAIAGDAGAAGPTIVVEDDGRGLDVDAIAERATQLGMEVTGRSRRSLSELVFVAGLSTRAEAGALAGRGVGLGAVREDLERVGYEVEVASEPGKYTRFTMKPRAEKPEG